RSAARGRRVTQRTATATASPTTSRRSGWPTSSRGQRARSPVHARGVLRQHHRQRAGDQPMRPAALCERRPQDAGARKDIMKIIALTLACIVTVAGATPAAAKCAFQKSCTKKAFKCFKVKGTCTDTGIVGAGYDICWANGARLSQDGDTITVLGKKGRPCLPGTVGHGPNGEFQTPFVRNAKSYVFTANPDGTKS